jgi:hypothetical protein
MNALQESSAAPSIDNEAMSPRAGGIVGFDRRRSIRLDTEVKAMIYGGGRFAECTVLDVCERGARLKYQSEIKRRTILLKTPYMKTRIGTVRWRKDGELGIQFREKLAGDFLALLS